MAPKRPSVFISYAHHDGLDFTRRLAYSLSMYMDVFWDRNLGAGEYPEQLKNEILNRDFFLLVMTPSSIVSKWCMEIELGYAQEAQKTIVPVRPFNDRETDQHKLYDKNTYAAFYDDFDVGFRRVTAMMLGTPLSSWEYLSTVKEDSLLRETLRKEQLPTVIATQLSEWVIIDVLWDYVQESIRLSNPPVSVGNPRTIRGILGQCSRLKPEFAQINNSAAWARVEAVEKICNEQIKNVEDVVKAGGNIGFYVDSICENVKTTLRKEYSSSLKAGGVSKVNAYFDFNIAEKIRELILVHSRRSRYLY